MELLTLFNLCNKKKKLFSFTKSSRLTFACIANVINTKQVSCVGYQNFCNLLLSSYTLNFGQNS